MVAELEGLTTLLSKKCGRKGLVVVVHLVADVGVGGLGVQAVKYRLLGQWGVGIEENRSGDPIRSRKTDLPENRGTTLSAILKLPVTSWRCAEQTEVENLEYSGR